MRPRKDLPRNPYGRLIYDYKTAQCACGESKHPRAKHCLQCHRSGKSKRPPSLCACGQPKTKKAIGCLSCKRRRELESRTHICEWCRNPFEHVNVTDKATHALRFCSKKCSGAVKRLRYQAVREQRRLQEEAQRREREAERRLRLCRHCETPMGDLGSAWVHASCRKEYLRATYVSKNRPYTGMCLWCGRPFEYPTSKGHPYLCASKRCRRRWGRVSRKHGLTRTTDPAIIQGYRVLGDVYYAIQCVKSADTCS